MMFLFFLLFLAALGYAVYKALGLTRNERGKLTTNFSFKAPIPGLALAVIPFLLMNSYVKVESGSMGVVYNQGKATRVIDPGPHFLVPFLETVGTVSNKTLVVKPNENGSSNDLQQVTTQVTLAYHFDPGFAMYFATQLIDNQENAVENKAVYPAIIEAVKATTAQHTATDLVQKRPLVRDEIEAMVKARLAQYHIIAETVSITDFQFSKEYNDSIEAKVTAQQNAEKAQNDLVRIKVEAEQAAAEAKGKADAAVEAAKGEAQAILTKANAQAEANRKLASSLTQELILNKAIDRWDGVRPMVEGGKSGLLLQLPAMSRKAAAQQAAANSDSDDNN